MVRSFLDGLYRLSGYLAGFFLAAIMALPIFFISEITYAGALTVVIPFLERLSKEGEQGRRKITQYTRYGTVALSLFQSIAAASWLQSQPGVVVNPGTGFLITAIITLVTGTMFLMWLGEQITERGLGNGI